MNGKTFKQRYNLSGLPNKTRHIEYEMNALINVKRRFTKYIDYKIEPALQEAFCGSEH